MKWKNKNKNKKKKKKNKNKKNKKISCSRSRTRRRRRRKTKTTTRTTRRRTTTKTITGTTRTAIFLRRLSASTCLRCPWRVVTLSTKCTAHVSSLHGFGHKKIAGLKNQLDWICGHSGATFAGFFVWITLSISIKRFFFLLPCCVHHDDSGSQYIFVTTALHVAAPIAMRRDRLETWKANKAKKSNPQKQQPNTPKKKTKQTTQLRPQKQVSNHTRSMYRIKTWRTCCLDPQTQAWMNRFWIQWKLIKLEGNQNQTRKTTPRATRKKRGGKRGREGRRTTKRKRGTRQHKRNKQTTNKTNKTQRNQCKQTNYHARARGAKQTD